MQKIKSIAELETGKGAYFKVETDKAPLSYKLGENMSFHFTLCDAEGEPLSCPQIKYMTRIDGTDDVDVWKSVDGSEGQLTISVKPTIPGFAYVRVWACDEEGNRYPNSEECNAGAGADVEKIRTAAPEPEDFDKFWENTVKVLNDIEPTVLEMTKLDPEKWGFEPEKYTTYCVRVASVDGEYASGFLSIPYDAEVGKCALRLDFHGYGFKNAFGKYVPKTIVFDVIAHSIPATLSKEEFAEIEKKPPFCCYGMWGDSRNLDRETVYFKNMLLRDLQAARFLMRYFGSDEGGNLWDGRTIGTRGGSQGAFQATAVGALLRHFEVEPSFLIYNMPWLCDVGGAKFGGRYRSRFLPDYTDALLYYDTTYFAKRIRCKALEGVTGLGDTCAIPSATMSYFNALGSEKKIITFQQNGVHGGHGRIFENFSIEK